MADWTHCESPSISATEGRAVYWTDESVDGTPLVLWADRAVTADFAFVTVAEVADPDDAEAVFAAVEFAPQIMVPLTALVALGDHFKNVIREEFGGEGG